MFCTQCGKELREGALFCSNCGAPLAKEPVGKVCPACGASAEEDMIFCDRCGSRLIRKTGEPAAPVPPLPVPPAPVPPPPVPPEPVPPTPVPPGPSRELVTMKMMSWYKGETKVGIAKASGTLTVFTDRVELKKQMGNAAAALSPIAFVAGAAKAAKSAAEVFWMRDIVEAKEGRYGGVFPSLVITMRGGEKHTFAGSGFGGDKIRESVELIRRYCGR